jgi:ubiquinone/menaquinone biosynthesis C-methylase UbiE
LKLGWQIQPETLDDFIGCLVDYEDAEAIESINRFGLITRIEKSDRPGDEPGTLKVWGYWSDDPEYVMYMVHYFNRDRYFAETFWPMLPEDANKLKVLKRVINSSLKFSWSQFPAFIQDLQEGDIIWDDGNDKYRIKKINYEDKEVLLEEVFASGNFDAPFWINEQDMLEHGFYKDPPHERFRRGMESSLKFSSLTDKNEQLFNQRYKNYGEDGGNLFWSDKENQYKRFKLLSDIGILNEATILDVGVGFGDLLDYFEESNIKPEKYLGIDVVPAIIQIAKKKHTEYPFYVRDIVKEPFPENSFDFCIGSGLFALNDKDWSESVVNLVKSMYNTCKKGVAVNFLSGKVLSDMFRTTTKEEIFKLTKDNVTNDMKIIESNDIEDITLYLYKQE